eukprot:1942967-Rhodomonas_salina.1
MQGPGYQVFTRYCRFTQQGFGRLRWKGAGKVGLRRDTRGTGREQGPEAGDHHDDDAVGTGEVLVEEKKGGENSNAGQGPECRATSRTVTERPTGSEISEKMPCRYELECQETALTLERKNSCRVAA